eukprot:2351850-Prymnesium_polylepis.1
MCSAPPAGGVIVAAGEQDEVALQSTTARRSRRAGGLGTRAGRSGSGGLLRTRRWLRRCEARACRQRQPPEECRTAQGARARA